MSEQAVAPVVEQTPSTETQTQEAAPAAEASTQVEQAEKAVADAKTPTEKKVAEKQLKKFKLKVDGKEFEEELDLSDEAELTKRFQLAKAAQSRMAEKAHLEKSLEQFINLIRTDPMKVLSHPDIGVDVKKFAQEIINRDLEEQQKSPEQKEKEKLERELKEIKEKYETEKKQKEQDELTRLQSEQEEKITNEFVGALEAVKLPKSERAIRYMAEYSALALQNGYDVPAVKVAELVKDQMVKEYTEMLRQAPDEILEQFIDKDMEGRLQKRRLASIKKIPEAVAAIKPTGVGSKTTSATPSIQKKTIGRFLTED
jgi:hypothetical protein